MFRISPVGVGVGRFRKKCSAGARLGACGFLRLLQHGFHDFGRTFGPLFLGLRKRGSEQEASEGKARLLERLHGHGALILNWPSLRVNRRWIRLSEAISS